MYDQEQEKRIDGFAAKARLNYEKGKEWFKENKELATVLGPVVLGGFIEICKIISRSSTAKENKRLKENYIYDRSAGHYYETKRKLKSREWLQFDEMRTTTDMSVGEILDEMKLLKK